MKKALLIISISAGVLSLVAAIALACSYIDGFVKLYHQATSLFSKKAFFKKILKQ